MLRLGDETLTPQSAPSASAYGESCTEDLSRARADAPSCCQQPSLMSPQALCHLSGLVDVLRRHFPLPTLLLDILTVNAPRSIPLVAGVQDHHAAGELLRGLKSTLASFLCMAFPNSASVRCFLRLVITHSNWLKRLVS